MSQQGIQDVIIERVFEAIDANGIAEEIKLILGRPYIVSESSSNLICRGPFQIVGIGSEKIHEAPGIDLLDALFNSLRLAEALLDSYSKHNKKRITWLNEDDLGLSTLPLPQDSDQIQSTFDAEDIFKTAFDKFFRDRKSKDDM